MKIDFERLCASQKTKPKRKDTKQEREVAERVREVLNKPRD